MRKLLYKIQADEKGATLVEFAVVIPVLTAMLLGVFDIGYRQYMSVVLQGEVQKAGRDIGLKGESTANSSIDARVRNRIQTVNSGATLTFDRKSIVTFDRAGRTEDFVDTPDPITGVYNGTRDPGECFKDENGNGIWDIDSGIAGGGSPEDIVKYTVTASYQSPFPIFSILGWPSTQTLTSSTVLRNQPFADRVARTTTTICT
jgi:Flp pilus assembly protein TadG